MSRTSQGPQWNHVPSRSSQSARVQNRPPPDTSIAMTARALAQRHATSIALHKRLPAELIDQICSYVDGSNQSSDQSHQEFSAKATEQSAQLFLSMPLEIRQDIYSYFLPDKQSWMKIGHVKKAKDADESEGGVADADSGIQLTGAEEELRKATIANKQQREAATKVNAVTLMLVNNQFCTEVATVLYEQYTFELDLADGGIRFLDLPVINHLEQYGFALSHGESKFGSGTLNQQLGNNKSNWIFSFSRLKKLRLNIWGGFLRMQNNRRSEWKNKQKCLYMRQNMEQLVRLLIGDGTLPHLNHLEVAILDGNRNMSYEWDSPDDLMSSFWYQDGTHAPRYSLLAIEEGIGDDEAFTNENFILQPLEALRGLSRISFERYTLNDHETPFESFEKPLLEKKMKSKEEYFPDPKFQRHVAQMEEALDGLKQVMRAQRQQHEHQFEMAESMWMAEEGEDSDAEDTFDVENEDDDMTMVQGI